MLRDVQLLSLDDLEGTYCTAVHEFGPAAVPKPSPPCRHYHHQSESTDDQMTASPEQGPNDVHMEDTYKEGEDSRSLGNNGDDNQDTCERASERSQGRASSISEPLTWKMRERMPVRGQWEVHQALDPLSVYLRATRATL